MGVQTINVSSTSGAKGAGVGRNRTLDCNSKKQLQKMVEESPMNESSHIESI
jgi:hypothetical protein